MGKNKVFSTVISAPIISVVNNEEGISICDAVGILKNLLNSHYNRKAEKILDIAED